MKRSSLNIGLAAALTTASGFGLFGPGCTTGESIETAKSALTQTQQDILGFEKPHLWSDPSGPVSTTNPDRTEGQKSLKVKPQGYVPYVSKPLASLGPVGSTVAYDLKLSKEQANPYWFGATQMFISIPSRGVHNFFAGQKELTGLAPDQWLTISFTLPANLTQTLGTTSYTDLTLTIVLNVPSNAKGTYLLDNVRFSAASNGGTGGAPGTGGAATGGAGTGGAATGGGGTGGAGTGGANTGGAGTGGAGTGGASTGGANTGGANTGGANTGGANTGGANTGGANTGGANTGGANTGGANTGGANTGGAGTGGAGTGGAGTGGAGTGGAGGSCVPSHCPGAICDQCTADNCIASTDGCDQITNAADRALCEAVYACFANPANACVSQGDPLKCWCGTNPTTCVTSNVEPTRANGPCLDAILAAARLTTATYDAATIKQRFVDTEYPLGRAVNLTSCRGSFCSAECSVP